MGKDALRRVASPIGVLPRYSGLHCRVAGHRNWLDMPSTSPHCQVRMWLAVWPCRLEFWRLPVGFVGSSGWINSLSQDDWFIALGPVGAVPLKSVSQISRVDVMNGSEAGWQRTRMSLWRSSVAAADAKKAEGASISTLRTPSPSQRIGWLAWIQARSLISQLMIDERPVLATGLSSIVDRLRRTEQEREERKTFKSLGLL